MIGHKKVIKKLLIMMCFGIILIATPTLADDFTSNQAVSIDEAEKDVAARERDEAYKAWLAELDKQGITVSDFSRMLPSEQEAWLAAHRDEFAKEAAQYQKTQQLRISAADLLSGEGLKNICMAWQSTLEKQR